MGYVSLHVPRYSRSIGLRVVHGAKDPVLETWSAAAEAHVGRERVDDVAEAIADGARIAMVLIERAHGDAADDEVLQRLDLRGFEPGMEDRRAFGNGREGVIEAGLSSASRVSALAWTGIGRRITRLTSRSSSGPWT